MVLARSLLMCGVCAVSGYISPLGLDAASDVWRANAAQAHLVRDFPLDGGEPPLDASSLAADPRTSGSSSLSITRDADGLFYVHAKINGKPIRFVVDTGSTEVFLTRRDAQALGIVPGSGAYRTVVQTANGNTGMAWTTLDRVEVGQHNISGIRAAVIREGLSVSLMGQSMLSRFASVTIAGDRLRLD